MAIFQGADRSPRHGFYEIDGQRFVRVSSVLGVIAKPGLEAWRQKVGTEEAQRISREAAARGTAIHKLCEDMDLARSVICPTEFRPSLDAYLAWKAEQVRWVLMVERVVAHRRHRYAGTIDRLVELNDGRIALVDLKTGKSVDGIYRLQSIAYVEALEDEGVQVDARLILHLPSTRPGESRVIEYDDDARDRRAWRSALRLFRWNKRHINAWKETR